jgi:myo-inositol 2-dehydrogenase/D-chiro-inositol 1-dehydrogenase
MSDNLRVAVIGAGLMGADHVERLARRTVGAKVAAVVDVDRGRAEAAARVAPSAAVLTSLSEALARDDVNAVLLATPGKLHEATLIEILTRDIPVLCEKPLTPDAASSWRVVEAEERLGHKRIQVGFMRRFDPEYQELRAIIASGELGAALMFHCVHRNPTSTSGFTTQMLINDSVVHEFDIIRYLTGEEIASVLVRFGRRSRNAHPSQQDLQHVLIETDGGLLADVEMFVNARYGYEVSMQAVLEDGTVTIGGHTGPLFRNAGRWGGAVTPSFPQRFRAAFDAEVQSWVDAARRGEIGGPSAWHGYATAACCEAGVEAQRTGAKIAVALRDKPSLYRD